MNPPAKRLPLPPEISAALTETTSRAVTAFQAANMDQANVAQALEVAATIDDLRTLFDRPEVKSRITALQDTALGFRTDRDPTVKNRKTQAFNEPYPWPAVRDAAIEATLRGLQLVGNQFNVISGRFYATREGFEFLIRRRKDVTDFRMNVGVPSGKQGGALVECEATWKNQGQPQSLKATIPVKGDDFSGADQYIGKAVRKFLKRCYEAMTGNVMPEGDATEPHVELAAPGQASGAATPFAGRGRAPAAQAATTARTADPAKPAAAPAPGPQAPPSPPPKPEPPREPAAPVGGEPAPADSPRYIVGEVLRDSGIDFEAFVGWLAGSGRITGADAIVMEGLEDVPEPVLQEILANQMAGLRKCVTIHGKPKA